MVHIDMTLANEDVGTLAYTSQFLLLELVSGLTTLVLKTPNINILEYGFLNIT
jgi:hypothetical protein